MIDRLILGTANFGMEYGIANKRKLNHEEVFEILEYASACGIWGIDTARGYGDSEAIIGQYFKSNGKSFRVISKLSRSDYKTAEEVEKEVFKILENLHIDSVDVLLVHNFAPSVAYKKILIPALRRLQRYNIIGCYGISVYYPAEIKSFLSEASGNIAIEFPLNLFDHRFLHDDYIGSLRSKGHLFFARSVFLQGLFFLDERRLYGSLKKAMWHIKKLDDLSRSLNMGKEGIALQFVAGRDWLSGFVLGVDSKEQLRKNIEWINECNPRDFKRIEELVSDLELNEEDIILPFKWATGQRGHE